MRVRLIPIKIKSMRKILPLVLLLFYSIPSFAIEDESSMFLEDPNQEETQYFSNPVDQGESLDAYSEQTSNVMSRDQYHQAEELNYDPRVPLFHQLPSTFGLEFNSSYTPFSLSSPGKSINVAGEFQFVYLQKKHQGVLGVGPVLSYFPVKPESTRSNPTRILGLGASLRYQLKYWVEQPFVPSIGYAAQVISYQSGVPTQFLLHTVSLGGALLLNFIDRSGAAAFYSEYRVLRSYLVAEMKILKGGDSALSLSQNAFFFGLRFEY